MTDQEREELETFLEVTGRLLIAVKGYGLKAKQDHLLTNALNNVLRVKKSINKEIKS